MPDRCLNLGGPIRYNTLGDGQPKEAWLMLISELMREGRRLFAQCDRCRRRVPLDLSQFTSIPLNRLLTSDR